MSRYKASFGFRVGANDLLQSSPRVIESLLDVGNFGSGKITQRMLEYIIYQTIY